MYQCVDENSLIEFYQIKRFFSLSLKGSLLVGEKGCLGDHRTVFIFSWNASYSEKRALKVSIMYSFLVVCKGIWKKITRRLWRKWKEFPRSLLWNGRTLLVVCNGNGRTWLVVCEGKAELTVLWTIFFLSLTNYEPIFPISTVNYK